MGTTPTTDISWQLLAAFGQDANKANPVWTDISADVMGIETQRGSPADLDRNNPGSMTVVLDNFTGAYDNTNAAGANFGNLLPEVHVRLSAEFDGTVYGVFDGYADAWELEYPDVSGADAIAILTATDGFKPLAGQDLPTSAYAAEVQADSPTHWWRLGEPAGATTAFDSEGADDLTVAGQVTFGTAGLVSRDTDTAATFSDATFGRLGAVGPAPSGTGAFTIELVVDDVVSTTIRPIFETSATTTTDMRLRVNVGSLTWACGSGSVSASSGNAADGLRHHIVVQRGAAGQLLIFFDGVDVTGAADSDSTDLPSNALFVLGVVSLTALPFGGVLDEVAIYNTALSATRIAAHAAAVATPWNGDTPAQRAGRILDIAAWPAGFRHLDTGDSVLQSANIAGQDALEHCQKVGESEFGDLSMTKDGVVRLTERTAKVNRAPLVFFGDAATGEVQYHTVAFQSDGDLIRNSVTISRLEGVAQNVEDATSIARFYRKTYTLDGLLHNSDILSRDAATFLVSEFKDPIRRIVGLAAGPAPPGRLFDLYPAALTLELGDRISVTFRPPNVAAAFVQESVIEGVRHRWAPDQGHQVAYDLSPAFAGTFLQLDSAQFGILDTGRLYF